MKNLPLTAGHEYFILLGRSTCFTFDILIRQSSTAIADLGKTCCNPMPMVIPFSQDNLTTGGFDDDYGSNDVCSGAGFGNNVADYDRVWSYVSAGSECIDIVLDRDSVNTVDPRGGVWITYESCPYDPNINCIGGTDQEDQVWPTNREFGVSVALTNAGTYYIFVASWVTPIP